MFVKFTQFNPGLIGQGDLFFYVQTDKIVSWGQGLQGTMPYVALLALGAPPYAVAENFEEVTKRILEAKAEDAANDRLGR
jgi:hypothetical protein